MDDSGLSVALDRAERALVRIEQAISRRQPGNGGDEELRSKVKQAVAELDQLIREAGR